MRGGWLVADPPALCDAFEGVEAEENALANEAGVLGYDTGVWEESAHSGMCMGALPPLDGAGE